MDLVRRSRRRSGPCPPKPQAKADTIARMKAIVVKEFGAPDVMKLEDAPDPSPGSGQVLIRVHAVGVNPVETYIRAGTYARKPNLPYIPGSDVGGTVEKVGPGVTAFKPGDRVYTHGVTGGYAQRLVCDESLAHPLPARVSFAQGAALGVPYATAWRALFMRARAHAGETLLVHGASGGVGTAAVQIARACGMQVIGTAGTAEGLELVRAHGAHHALNHREAAYLDQVMQVTDGRGVDVVLEMLANVNLEKDLTVIALRGRVCVIGNRGRIEIDPRKAMSKEAAIFGVQLGLTPPDDLQRLHALIGAGLENGTLTPVVGKEYPLGDAPKAHAAVMEPGAYGKIVLVP
jgi:NADPH2:quinone reductase